MKQERAAMKRVISKIKSAEDLPTYEEAEQLLNFLETRHRKNHRILSWSDFCILYHAYNVYTVEFVDQLAEELRRLDDSPIIEICAGDGKLAYQLQKRGVGISATDDCSWELSNGHSVESLSHTEALKKYAPRIVVASWIPRNTRIGFDVLDFPSVKYLINIGEGIGGTGWLTEEAYSRKDFEITTLEQVQKFSICRTDYTAFMEHSEVLLFRKLSHDVPSSFRDMVRKFPY